MQLPATVCKTGTTFVKVVCTHTGALGRLRQEEHKFKASLRNFVSHLKTISKKSWAYSSEVALPPSIQEVLGSIPSTTKEKKKKKNEKTSAQKQDSQDSPPWI